MKRSAQVPGYVNIPGLQEKIEEVVEEAVGELSVVAGDVAVTPAGNIAATDVQSALQELDSEKAAASHTHAQADVTNLTSDLAAKAPLASPTFTGTPAAPTASADTNTTQIATTAYVQGELTDRVVTSRNLTAGNGLSGGGDLSADRTFALDLSELTTDATGGATNDLIPFVDVSGSNSSDKVLVSDFITNAGIATLASPALSGNPTAPTASGDDNDTSIATTAFVQGEINDRVRCWSLEILDPVVGRYTFARKPGCAGDIQALVHLTNQGTVTADVEIDGTDVTSLAALSIGNSETTTSATAAKTFTSGQRVELNITAISGGVQKLTCTLQYKRTGTT